MFEMSDDLGGFLEYLFLSAKMALCSDLLFIKLFGHARCLLLCLIAFYNSFSKLLLRCLSAF